MLSRLKLLRCTSVVAALCLFATLGCVNRSHSSAEELERSAQLVCTQSGGNFSPPDFCKVPEALVKVQLVSFPVSTKVLGF